MISEGDSLLSLQNIDNCINSLCVQNSVEERHDSQRDDGIPEAIYVTEIRFGQSGRDDATGG